MKSKLFSFKVQKYAHSSLYNNNNIRTIGKNIFIWMLNDRLSTKKYYYYLIEVFNIQIIKLDFVLHFVQYLHADIRVYYVPTLRYVYR